MLEKGVWVVCSSLIYVSFMITFGRGVNAYLDSK